MTSPEVRRERASLHLRNIPQPQFILSVNDPLPQQPYPPFPPLAPLAPPINLGQSLAPLAPLAPSINLGQSLPPLTPPALIQQPPLQSRPYIDHNQQLLDRFQQHFNERRERRSGRPQINQRAQRREINRQQREEQRVEEERQHRLQRQQSQQEIQEIQAQEEEDYDLELSQRQQDAAQAQVAFIIPISVLPPGCKPYQEPLPNGHIHTLGPMDSICPHCHAFHFLEEKLTASSKKNPKFSVCCLQGKINLPAFTPHPNALNKYFTTRSLAAIHFRKNIRKFNSALAFTSVAVKMDERVTRSSGPYSFCIHGSLHHRMGSLLHQPDHLPIYAQLYIIDPNEAHQARTTGNPRLSAFILQDLQDILEHNNPFVPLYRQVSFYSIPSNLLILIILLLGLSSSL
jgi:flagellar biosynthesis GTPase FlhF